MDETARTGDELGRQLRAEREATLRGVAIEHWLCDGTCGQSFEVTRSPTDPPRMGNVKCPRCFSDAAWNGVRPAYDP
jgi:hypothetical protein